jgi:hypothetical protein
MKEVKVPSGLECQECGTLAEAWPNKTLEELVVDLESPAFEALWAVARKRLRVS